MACKKRRRLRDGTGGRHVEKRQERVICEDSDYGGLSNVDTK